VRALRIPRSSTCPRPTTISEAPGTGKTVALTFDDGASDTTVAIADTLKARGVPATFFDIGAQDEIHRSVVRQVAALGFPVEDHSWDHHYPNQVPGGWTVPYLRSSIRRTADLQQRLTGHRTCFFRPPGGFMTNVKRAAYGLGLSVVLWYLPVLFLVHGFALGSFPFDIVPLALATGGLLLMARPVLGSRRT
jgi:peptidoglycan/xylan/chitin deacetylase (PgdA/CDA1 family)